MAKARLVTGLFKNRVAAEAAVDALLKRGYTRDDISVLMSDATRNKEFAVQARTHAADGAGIGGALGTAVGAVLATIVAVGSTIFLPRHNLFIAGPIAAAFAGAGAGAVTGGVIGALIGAGIPEYRKGSPAVSIQTGNASCMFRELKGASTSNNQKKFGRALSKARPMYKRILNRS